MTVTNLVRRWGRLLAPVRRLLSGVLRSLYSMLAFLNFYSVPLAAAVLGSLFGARFLHWMLEVSVPHFEFHHPFAASSLLMYGTQCVAARLLFLIANRYLN